MTEPVSGTWRLGHRPALDGLRGLAVLLVIAGHMQIPWLDSGGWVGVTLFFVLSGFLITTLLVEDGFSLRRFYERRARRLLPALAFYLAVTFVVFAQPLDRLAAVALYVGNWKMAVDGTLGVWDHLWSLAIEEQFYLVWPVLLVIGLRFRWFLWAVLAGAVGSAVLRAVVFLATDDLNRAYVGTDTRADALLLGAALALVFQVKPWAPSRLAVLVAVAGCAVVAAPSGQEGQAIAAPALLVLGLFIAGLAGVILTAHAVSGSRLLSFAPLRWIGGISYALYLWSDPLSTWGWEGIGLAFVLAWISTRYVERRWRHLSFGDRDRLDVRVRERRGGLVALGHEV